MLCAFLRTLSGTHQQWSQTRQRLLDLGLIDAPAYGEVSIALPFLRDYINANIDLGRLIEERTHHN